ncbi:MAG: POTRA domain-containing protein [Pyrinomonadaceae bacterium]
MKLRASKFVFVLLVLSLTSGYAVYAQQDSEKDVDKDPCAQSPELRIAMAEEAERDQFTITRVYFFGNQTVRDRDLRKKLKRSTEGDIFTLSGLEGGIKRMSKMVSIYPITLENVALRLDRPRKDINMTFCVKERPKQ